MLIRQCRPIAAAAAAAVVLSSAGAFSRTAPNIVPTETIAVQLQAAVADLALNTTATAKAVTEPPTATAMATGSNPFEWLQRIDELGTVVIAVGDAAVTVVGAAAWLAAFPITLPLSYIVAQVFSAPGNELIAVLGAGGGVGVFFGVPFLAVSVAVGGIQSALRELTRPAAALASPRAAAAGTPIDSAARRPAAQPVGTPHAAAIRPARAAAAESTHAAPNPGAIKPAAAHATAVTAKRAAAQSRQATPRYAARIASSVNSSAATPVRVTVPVSRM
ncbi:hypothetical protein MCEMAEM6B_00380 [Mycobacteriaceae bacterium]